MIRVAFAGEEPAGKEFIDATYEGDLVAKAGVSYTVGRESAAEYGEKTAGVHPYMRKASQNTIDRSSAAIRWQVTVSSWMASFIHSSDV